MSNRQKKSKPMSISDISKRMTTKSHIRKQSSTSVPNPPKLTNTEPTNITVDGYSLICFINLYFTMVYRQNFLKIAVSK